jgi:hypothetical protein
MQNYSQLIIFFQGIEIIEASHTKPLKEGSDFGSSSPYNNDWFYSR